MSLNCLCSFCHREIVAGLKHLHKLKIIHRDLKPHNMLRIKGECICVKLVDIGISKRLVGDYSSSLGSAAATTGTLGWRPPEQILDAGSQTRAMDMFSLGCVLFFCMTSGKHPFGDTPPECDTNVINNKMNLSLLEHIPEAGDLCSQLLNHDPKLRYNITIVKFEIFFFASICNITRQPILAIKWVLKLLLWMIKIKNREHFHLRHVLQCTCMT
ncbi:putative protein kinase IRE1 family [Helianthus annuus]|nr:putative protein kinase IRE1 family [Helianthus annuus]